MRIDVGLPINKKSEFDQFYVDSNNEQFIRYKTWLESQRSKPLMISGQIGSGKTTFIHYGCLVTSTNQVIKIKFDIEPISFTLKGFTALLFAKTLKWITDWNADLGSILRPEIKELFPDILSPNFIVLLSERWLGTSERAKQKSLFEVIATESELILEQIDELLNLVDDNFRSDVIIFAEGIDKFQPRSPEFFELESVLDILKRHKTLFETNLVHYFFPSKIWGRDIQKIIIPTVNQDQIIDCLKKRLGQFHIVYSKEIAAIAELSGGNYRQAVRLLSEYEYATTNLNKSEDEAIDYAINRTIDNFLSYSNVLPNFETLGIINRDGFITSGVAQHNASLIFNNHIFIQNELSDLKWSCIVNPLLENNLEQINPVDSNLEPLYSWAALSGTTTTGLTNTILTKEQVDEYLSSFKTSPLNISEAFTALSSLFLSGFNEIVIITYQDKEVAEIANDYFLGNVGNVTDLKFSKIIQLKKIEDITSVKNSFDASIFFMENYDKRFLKELDHSRDLLILKNMLWWVKQNELLNCLDNWPHLRQFLKIYPLDESIRSFITVDEINDDLSTLEEMGYNEKTYAFFKEKLERVLNYLKEEVAHE
jgi:hypothetical protein